MKIVNSSQLRELYGQPSERAKNKVLSIIDKHALNFIEQSPFLLLSTSNKEGNMDTSPRGGSAGFVQVLGDKTLLIPDAKGNNRIDSLENIVETGRISSLFLIPGIDEALRINGKAHISIEKEHLDRFSSERIQPKSCIIIEVEELFLHCAKALMRSKLWDVSTQISRPGFPTMGQMLKDQLGGEGKLESQEDMLIRYQKDL